MLPLRITLPRKENGKDFAHDFLRPIGQDGGGALERSFDLHCTLFSPVPQGCPEGARCPCMCARRCDTPTRNRKRDASLRRSILPPGDNDGQHVLTTRTGPCRLSARRSPWPSPRPARERGGAERLARWADGKLLGHRSPGRCPELGERPGPWPAQRLPGNLATPIEGRRPAFAGGTGCQALQRPAGEVISHGCTPRRLLAAGYFCTDLPRASHDRDRRTSPIQSA